MQKVILCVDDEKSILWGLQQQIERAFPKKFLIELAESAEEAIEIIKDLQTKSLYVSMLITDQMMPGMKGHELIKYLLAESPQTKCVLLSGYAANEVVEEVLLNNLCKFMKKPWNYEELIQIIQTCGAKHGI